MILKTNQQTTKNHAKLPNYPMHLTRRRKNKFGIVAALDANGIANGELYWDDGEELGR